MAVKRDIKYINRDFSELRDNLINFTQTYFPTTYNDFSQASPGMLFMEMAAYVGDVLSFYLDNQIQENFLQFARQTDNLFQLAYMFGYRPRVTGVSTVDVDFYQQVPAVGGQPDFSYALQIDANATLRTTDKTQTFITEDSIDFAVSSSLDPTEVNVFSESGGTPNFFLLKKTRKTTSATINTTTFTFGSPQKFSTVEITADSFISILDIVDSDGNTWYEVDYLGQDAVFDSIKNTNINDPVYSTATDTPYLLKLKSVQRRFVSRVSNENTVQLQFGAGTTADNDATLVPNPDNVGLGLPYGRSKLTTAFDPTNFVFTNTYGIAPSNTTLTVRYLVGGGVAANVLAGAITIFEGVAKFTRIQNDNTTSNAIFNTLAITNPQAASGGGDGDTIEELRQNTIASYNTQLRTVTQDDYLIRALSLPTKFGTISKAYVQPTRATDILPGEIPSILDLYILTYNSTGTLAVASQALKNNLSTYISQYRVVGDSVRIKDAFVINIGVDFEISTLPNFNSNLVLINCITALQDFFKTDNWQINQPINLKDVTLTLDKVQGVQSVKSVSISNKYGISAGYSQYAYDVTGATVNSVIYPSLDPSIFEVKYPNSDITGRIVTN
jgi:hypothetical protein